MWVEGTAVVFGWAKGVSVEDVSLCVRDGRGWVEMAYRDGGSCLFLFFALATGSNFSVDGPFAPWKLDACIPSSFLTASALACRRHCVDHACCVRGCDARIRRRKDFVTSCNAMMAGNQWQCSGGDGLGLFSDGSHTGASGDLRRRNRQLGPCIAERGPRLNVATRVDWLDELSPLVVVVNAA